MSAKLDLPPRPRILVVALRRLGDVLLTTPLTRSLRKAWPEARIEMLVFADTAEILEGNPDIDAIVTCPERPTASESLALARRLWRGYDLAITTQAGDRPSFFAIVAGRKRVGVTEARLIGKLKALFLHRHAGMRSDLHRVEETLLLADLLGIARAPEIVPPRASNASRRSQPYAMLHASPFFRYKQWHAEGWRELARFLSGRGLQVVATGGPGEQERAYLDAVWDSTTSVERLDGRLNWPALTALLTDAQIFIGPDTSVTHLAAASGCPTVALFGPTDSAPLGTLAGRGASRTLATKRKRAAARSCLGGPESAAGHALWARRLSAPHRKPQSLSRPDACRHRSPCCGGGACEPLASGWRRAQNVAIQSVDPLHRRRQLMFRFRTMTTRKALIVLHDLLVTAAALVAAFYLRFEEQRLSVRVDWLWWMLPAILVYAGIVYHFFHLDDAKWRFASLPDSWNIFRSATVLAITLLVLDYILVAPNMYGDFFFGKATILIYWVLQMFFLGGPRIAYRYFRYSRARMKASRNDSAPILILGRAADAEVLLRAIESGAVKKTWPVGVLSQSPADQGQSIRGIRVLGTFDDLETAVSDLANRGTNVRRVVLTPSAFEVDVATDTLLMRARRLGLTTSRLPSLDDSVEALRLAPVNVEDLLLRPSVKIDYRRLENFIKGRSVVVTGGGGSIGAEICDRIVTFGASRLLVIENSEPALHAVLEALNGKNPGAEITGRLADIRDRERIMRLMADFKPEIVFHSAALKHVPLLEQDWGEGVKTNVFGSVNVADAAAASGATAMVMISTDKAIEPVSVLGATKRFAEMYCQALDQQFARKAVAGSTPMRLIAVRFGNVLASNGSVVPKFKAQIEAGGPVTVTHPDMVRYFMTIREACDLVVTAGTHAIGPERSDVAVYVLNMGQPVKIVELAERIIRLSGLEPGRDIDITFTGIRPGERLHEILFAREEPTADIGVAGVVAARPLSPSIDTMRAWLATLEQGLTREDRSAIYRVLRDAVPDFKGEAA